MHALPLYRSTHSPHDDVSPAQLPRWADSLPPFEAPQMIQPAPTFPRDLAEARASVAAKHGIQSLDVLYRIPTDALELVDVLAELREAGYEAWVKSNPDDPTLCRVFTRENALSLIDPDVLARARESAGLAYDDEREVA